LEYRIERQIVKARSKGCFFPAYTTNAAIETVVKVGALSTIYSVTASDVCAHIEPGLIVNRKVK